MSRYFDKDFVKFFIGFLAIILLSCVVIVAARLYESRSTEQAVPTTNIATPNS